MSFSLRKAISRVRIRRRYLVLGAIVLGALIFALYTSQIDALPQISHSLFPTLPGPTSKDRILVVSPHQDDEVLGAGGYLKAATSVGATVHVIFATDGNKHGLEAARDAEAVTADGSLGVPQEDISFYDYPDGNLSGHPEFISRLENDIQQFHPTVVITTLPEDTHPDHAAAGRAVKAAEERFEGQFTAAYFLIHYHRYPRPIGYKPDSYLLPPLELINSSYEWESFPISSNLHTAKFNAIAYYKTQLSYKNPILRQLLFSFDRQNELFAIQQ